MRLGELLHRVYNDITLGVTGEMQMIIYPVVDRTGAACMQTKHSTASLQTTVCPLAVQVCYISIPYGMQADS